MITLTFSNEFNKKYTLGTAKENFEKVVGIILKGFRMLTVVDDETGEVLLEVYVSDECFHRKIWEGEVLIMLALM